MDNYFDKIQDYIDGLLSPTDRKDFERAMNLNNALKEETLLQQELNQNIRKHLEANKLVPALTETLQQLNKEYFKDKQVRRLRHWFLSVSAAACIIIILQLSGVFSTTQFDQLPELPSAVTRSNDTGAIQQEKAVKAFNNKDYAASTNIWEQLNQADNGTDATTVFYLSLSYIGQKEYNKALPLLEKIANGPSVYKEDAAYFAGWIYYKKEKHDQSAYWLKQVSPKHTYFKKAQKLIKKQ